MASPEAESSETTFEAVRAAMRYVLLVALIAAASATVFTAWTPASILPSGAARQIAAALATRIWRDSTPPPPTATPRPRPLIGVVAGHMGNDSGAVCPDGLTEASVNLDVASRVQANLEKAGLRVDLLAEYDDRLVDYAAAAVVSIHSDSCEYINPEATGFKVAGALEGGAKDRTARLLACLEDRYAARTGLPFHPGSITPDMTDYHSFYEVDSNTPIAIIEVGFLNLDRQMLTERAELVAQGVTDGVLCFVYNAPVQ